MAELQTLSLEIDDLDVETLEVKTSNMNDTLVAEFTTNVPIGTDETGSQRVEDLLKELSEKIEMTPVAHPRTHLSPKYGLSGWAPGIIEGADGENKAAAIHTYVWEDRKPSFVSIDLNFPAKQFAQKVVGVMEHIRKKFLPVDIVQKQSGNVFGDWKNLAENIYRQRLMMLAQFPETPSDDVITAIFQDLCEVLKMDRLTSPLIIPDGENKHIWEHWETSGVIASLSKDNTLETNIYTCKEFKLDDALNFTKTRVGDILDYREF